MKKVLFSVIRVGQQFSLFSDGSSPATKIEPRARKSTVPAPACRHCGEPAATWVNAIIPGTLFMHVCPNEAVWVEENPVAEQTAATGAWDWTRGLEDKRPKRRGGNMIR